MRPLKTLTTILALVLLTASLAFAASYPSELPKDFENTKGQVICERAGPPATHLKAYFQLNEQTDIDWMILLIGKDKKDIFLGLDSTRSNGSGKKLNWLATENGWRILTDEEAESTTMMSSFFTEEELAHLLSCFKEKLFGGLGGFMP